ncbi:MAG: hypothetical protein ABIJ05_03745 [Patescibacteria group bacterium]
MAEKYRGILPPNSIWYKLDTNKASLILMHAAINGEIRSSFVDTNVFCHQSDTFTELQAPTGESEKLEEILKKYGEKITTLY